jgi:ABC-2 type transport system ATP-binding protein
MSPLLEVRQLERRDAGRVRVAGLSFALTRGEVVGLLGLNGAGKSTTLCLVAGALAPTAGCVLLEGADLATAPHVLRARVGFLPEPPPLYPELTVDEFLGFAARLRGLDRRAARGAVARVRERCGLGEVGRRLIGQLSKGYRQRVGLAQAIVHDPPLVLLDEPTAGLDPAQCRETRDLVADLGRDHAVLFSSHLLDEVERVCTRVEVLHHGRPAGGFALRGDGDGHGDSRSLEQRFLALTGESP